MNNAAAAPAAAAADADAAAAAAAPAAAAAADAAAAAADADAERINFVKEIVFLSRISSIYKSVLVVEENSLLLDVIN
ncbi:6-hydroxypseudooxynicotine dehydrogenase complex subunit alpha [Dirofilaria immitis]